MRKFFLITSLLFLSHHGFAQDNNTDKLHLASEVKDVVVEAVDLNVIKYRHPNENTVYSISKNRVEKITFSSGREEVFSSSFKPVKSLQDYEKVYISYVPQDVEGLNSKGEVFSKATGVTALASINNVNNRAVRKLKMEAAMLGANVVYIGNTFQRGNQYGNENVPANATMTSLSGTAYSTTEKLPDLQELKNKLATQKFVLLSINKLNRNAFDSKETIENFYDKNGNVNYVSFKSVKEIDGELHVTSPNLKSKFYQLKVISADDESIILMGKDNKTIYNYFMISENEPRIVQIRKNEEGKRE